MSVQAGTDRQDGDSSPGESTPAPEPGPLPVKTLDQLRQPDPRTLRFLPGGLGMSMIFEPDSAAEYQQEIIGTITLADDVGEGTRATFELLRTVWAYGVLCYEIFTLAGDHALLLIEQALRERFVEYHRDHRQGVVTFMMGPRYGRREQLPNVVNYEQVWDFIEAAKQKGHRWRLQTGADSDLIDFNGTMGGLLAWARTVGLLRGHRNRHVEKQLAKLRNLFAHAAGHHLDGPPGAIRNLRDVAEIVNQLWGHSTPGGQLYPAPIARDIVAIGFDSAGSCTAQLLEYAEPSTGDLVADSWQWIVARTVWGETDMLDFDSRYEVTRFPSQLLWGPGSRADAVAWYVTNRPEPDVFDYLDRTFLVRYDAPRLHLPQRLEAVAALADPDRAGVWYAIRADEPNTVWHHVLAIVQGGACSTDGLCTNCLVTTLATGPYADVVQAVPELRAATGGMPDDVQTGVRKIRFRDLEL